MTGSKDAMVADRSEKREERRYFEQQQLTDRVCERPTSTIEMTGSKDAMVRSQDGGVVL